MKDIFFNNHFIPRKAQLEFTRRWLIMQKPTIGEFIVAIQEDPNKKWWINMEAIKESYQTYLNGDIDSKYPAGLFDYPHQILIEVMEEVNEMIRF